MAAFQEHYRPHVRTLWSIFIEGVGPAQVVQEKTKVGEDFVTALASARGLVRNTDVLLANGVFFAHEPVEKEFAQRSGAS